jgi:YihY family inner membrane protein
MLAVVGGGIILTTLLTGFTGGIVNGFAARAVGVVLSVVINVGFFLLGFRMLTARKVALRQLLPGAVLAGVAWVALQVAGGYLVNRYVKGASEIYGTFAVVIGLLWWLYLQSLITLYAAELNVVLTERLWPRSLMGVRLEADRRTLQRHAEVEKR